MKSLNSLEARLSSNPYGGLPRIKKEVTFSNTDSDVSLFTVTGDVVAYIASVCKTNCASAGGCNVKVGTASKDDLFIVLTDVTAIAQDEIWHDNAPDSPVELLADAVKAAFISGGEDIVLDVEAAKQVDSGAITFYCWWFPVSDNGNVVAA